MSCSHCMIDASSPDGEHMSLETFDQALEITRFLGSNIVILSGGEPFEHPNIFTMIGKTQGRGLSTIVATNGLFVLDEAKYTMAVASGVMIQVTNDARYYPRSLKLMQHKFEVPGWSFENHIGGIFPCRRTREGCIKATRYSPTCFNIRSITNQYDIISAVIMQESKGKICSPSINVDGSIRAGETDTCFRLGTVDSTEAELDEKLRTMSCNICGLRDNLNTKHLKAIGEK